MVKNSENKSAAKKPEKVVRQATDMRPEDSGEKMVKVVATTNLRERCLRDTGDVFMVTATRAKALGDLVRPYDPKIDEKKEEKEGGSIEPAKE